MSTTSPTARLRRRTFLERLGLGAGAALLGPVAQSLVSEARGQTVDRRRAIFFLHGNGLSYSASFTPPEFAAGGKYDYPVLDGPKEYTWPSMLRSLERYRARMLLVDGLPNHPRTGLSQHGTGYSALSCFAAAHNGSNEGEGLPGNITIDQLIAGKLGASTRAKSVLYGASTRPAGVYARAFAAGPEKPEPHFQSPRLMFNDLFGALVTDADGRNRGAYKQGLLVDGMRADIKRLEGSLAGAERRKLEHYVGAIEDFDKRLKLAASLDCKAPPFAETGTTVEDRLEQMTEMATLALVCGLTNVVGVSVGVGDAHVQFPKYTRLHVGTRFEADGGIHMHGHSPPDVLGAAWDILHNFHGKLIARMADALAGIKEGDRTALDSSVLLYMSDNGGEHHSKHNRYPLVLLGNAGGKLKVDGRFIRYPAKGQKGSRSLADLYCTLATACGVPTESFGKGGNEPVQGPLSEILA
jgi:hypothetical protein